MTQRQTRTNSPLSQKEREWQRQQLEAQHRQGRLSREELTAALHHLEAPTTVKERR